MSDTWSSIQAHKKQLDSLRERLQRRRKQDSGHLGEARVSGRRLAGMGGREPGAKDSSRVEALLPAAISLTPPALVLPLSPQQQRRFKRLPTRSRGFHLGVGPLSLLSQHSRPGPGPPPPDCS